MNADRWNGLGDTPEDMPDEREPWNDPADDYRDSHPEE
jgi:hypothetical protein